MRPLGIIYRFILLVLILVLLGSCTSISPKAPIGNYYVTSEIAYLRDGPKYDGRVLEQLYMGDLVEKLESDASEWWRVRSGLTGQEGWIQAGLLSLNPVAITYYYVSRDTEPLRECPGEECPALQQLYRGDQVQPVEKNDRGWRRVLVVKDRGLGWLPEKAMTEQMDLTHPPMAAPNYYYVTVTRLKLYQQPVNSAKVVKTLEFNNQLQKLAESPVGWLKVRQPSSGAVGWVETRFLESLPLPFPRGSKRPKKKVPKSPKLEPEVM